MGQCTSNLLGVSYVFLRYDLLVDTALVRLMLISTLQLWVDHLHVEEWIWLALVTLHVWLLIAT